MSPLRRVPKCDRIERGLRWLPAREQLALRRRYVDWWTLKEIGAELGLSIERVRQIVARAEFRMALAIVYPELDFSETLDRKRIPAHPAEVRERAPRLGLPRRWESKNPSPVYAPVGTLEDVLEMLDPMPLEQRRRILWRAVREIERKYAIRTSGARPLK